jgi:hypothetical protein
MTQNIYAIIHIICYTEAIKTLAEVSTGGGGVGGAGGHMNFMPPGLTKIGFFSLF